MAMKHIKQLQSIPSLIIRDAGLKFVGINLGQIGANIGMGMGRSIEPWIEIGLATQRLRTVRNGIGQGPCSKKDPD